MTVYTEVELRQSTDAVLDRARSHGEVRIKRTDGQEFILRRADPARSPLDVPGVEANVTLDDILEAIRDGRERPRSALDVGLVTPRVGVTTDDIVAAVREGRDRE